MASHAGLYWLASYPRSGNTWVRFLLTAYFTGAVENGRAVARFAPDLHVDGVGGVPDAPGERVFVKTHFLCSDSHPLIERTRAAILLIRHPRDVLMSCIALHRALGTQGFLGGLSDEAYARAFIAAGGDPRWARSGLGSWERSVASWRGARGAPVLIVRYEDLLESAERELSRVLAFVGEPPHAGRVGAAVRACSLGAMREMEAGEKLGAGGGRVFSGSADAFRRGFPFVAQARRGSSLDELAPGLDAEFTDRFGAAMGANGYR